MPAPPRITYLLQAPPPSPALQAPPPSPALTHDDEDDAQQHGQYHCHGDDAFHVGTTPNVQLVAGLAVILVRWHCRQWTQGSRGQGSVRRQLGTARGVREAVV